MRMCCTFTLKYVLVMVEVHVFSKGAYYIYFMLVFSISRSA